MGLRLAWCSGVTIILVQWVYDYLGAVGLRLAWCSGFTIILVQWIYDYLSVFSKFGFVRPLPLSFSPPSVGNNIIAQPIS